MEGMENGGEPRKSKSVKVTRVMVGLVGSKTEFEANSHMIHMTHEPEGPSGKTCFFQESPEKWTPVFFQASYFLPPHPLSRSKLFELLSLDEGRPKSQTLYLQCKFLAAFAVNHVVVVSQRKHDNPSLPSVHIAFPTCSWKVRAGVVVGIQDSVPATISIWIMR